VAELVDGDDIGMIQRRCRLGFALKAAESLGVVRYVVTPQALIYEPFAGDT